MLGSVYCSLKGKPAWTAILLGVALSFKAQPVFLFPYLLLLIWLNRMSWRHLLLVPLAFAAMMLPAALLGRPFLGLLTVYYDQSRFFSKLAMNVANLYYFVPNDFYRIGTIVGMLVTSVTSLLYAWLPRARRVVASTEFLLLAATMSAAMVPFLLPKMHDRYFLPADLLSIALVFYVPRLWYFAAGFQVTSGLAYIPIITDSFSGYDNEFTDLMPLAAILNTILIGALAVVYVRWVRGSGVPAGSRVTGGGEEVGAVGERS
jgi:Gpi18-like mannosyltransferase